MKPLHSLSDLKKVKLVKSPAKPAVAPTAPDHKAEFKSMLHNATSSVPKRTPREELAALLGDPIPPPSKRIIGQKARPTESARNAPERPREAPKPRMPTVRLDGPAGARGLTGGDTAVLPPGETKLVVNADGFAPVEIRLLVEEPPPRVMVREDAVRDTALSRAEVDAARLRENLAKANVEIKSLSARLKSVIRINVEELFPGEAYEHIIETITAAAKAAKAVNGRRAEILDAVVKANPPSTTRRRRIVDEVIVFARRPGPRELARLAEIGIREVSKNKHYKLGYGRHTQTLALTPSDHRSGQNNAAEMKIKFF